MQDGFCAPKKIAVRPAALCKRYVIDGEALEDALGVLLEPTVPRLDIAHCFTKILVIGDRDMHRIDIAQAHLAKDLLGPVGILQRVDAGRGPCGILP